MQPQQQSTLAASSKRPPNGLVTYLFTDVEAYTRLWEHFPQQMRSCATTPSSRAAWHGMAGCLCDPGGEGDSRFAVFPRAVDAANAAVAIQCDLAHERWPTETRLRVRSALHTGEADLRYGDYYGTVVNRCARLRALAVGGQTLLTLVTHAAINSNPGTQDAPAEVVARWIIRSTASAVLGAAWPRQARIAVEASSPTVFRRGSRCRPPRRCRTGTSRAQRLRVKDRGHSIRVR